MNLIKTTIFVWQLNGSLTRIRTFSPLILTHQLLAGGCSVINLPNPKIAKMPAMVISNTCDIDQNNKRLAPKRIVYAPIYQLEKYKQLLMKDHAQSGAENPESIQRGGVIHHHNVKKTWSAPPLFFLMPKRGF